MNSHSQPDAEQSLADRGNTSGRAAGRRELWPRLRPVAAAFARTLASVTVVVHYLLPLDDPFGWGPVLALLGGLSSWQCSPPGRSARSCDHRIPGCGRRAAETLALTVSLILALFAAGYEALATADPAAFSEPLNRTDTLYFVVMVFATVGFGDISPVSGAARILAMVQMIADLVLIGLVVKTMLSAAERGRAGRASEARSSADGLVVLTRSVVDAVDG
jgi:voltage-gated potassium channel